MPTMTMTAVVAAQPGDQRPAALVSVIRLLREAGSALRTNRDEAHQCIERAAALVRAELAGEAPVVLESPRAARCQLAPWQVARVTAFVAAHLSETIAIETLAALARLSTSHFSRAFRSTVGVSPRAYVIRRRIECAQDMIRSTAKPLSEIALDCGLTDQAHLNKLFRRLVGISPGAWRRLHGSTAAIAHHRAQPGGVVMR